MNTEQGLLARAQSNHAGNRRPTERLHSQIDHDTWNLSAKRLPRASAIKLGHLHGILPFDGKRNPSSRSNTSQKVFFTYRTPANDFVPKIGIAESAAEAAVGIEAVISPFVMDVAFQPLAVSFRDERGATRSYTHDLLIKFRNGHNRLVFVRNGHSLKKPRTQQEIAAIAAATPKGAADDMIIVNANDYSRQRRDNLMRLHYFVGNPDEEADQEIAHIVKSGKHFYFMKDLFPYVSVAQSRAFAACHRLIAKKELFANLDNVLWENSRIELAA